MKTRSIVSGVAAAAVAAGLCATAWTQHEHSHKQGGPGGEMDMGRMLVNGLKGVEGCLGVEMAQTMSGKNAIFAWFEDKASVKRWYYSEAHQGVIETIVTNDDYTQRRPLESVPDDAGPIMVIASITHADRQHFDGMNLPISQIAIELYEALPGGAFLGSRFAPGNVEVAEMRDYTPKGEEHGHDHGHGEHGHGEHGHSHD